MRVHLAEREIPKGHHSGDVDGDGGGSSHTHRLSD